ncbi:Protein transport protein Sec61 subunit beta [Echinococcus granulosus]|uniref:Protein transport protein Sec61 subunit beta n=1 Tax=Echinococcus granulosus TaxID=6210 RepID=W6U9C4_ECHGR|nr:Protein transport protein Sec61 subunit beta [Echinococcus granulosus]EUB57963.1 Protein transport protein Sec61 subunit beta [Echinococcus granulosus]
MVSWHLPLANGSSSKSGSGSGAAARGSGGGIRQRRSTAAPARRPLATTTPKSPVFLFYSEDSPGIKIGPVPVLVMCLCFIVSVFLLHFWGKYTRST